MFFNSKLMIACLAVSALTAFGIGCGDDDSDGSGSKAFSTSVDGSAELGSLSSEDAKQLCEDRESFDTANTPSDFKEKACQVEAVITASIAYDMNNNDLDAAKTACVEARDECLADEDKNDPKDNPDACTDPAQAPQSCTVTVDEYIACKETEAAKMINLLNNADSCDNITQASFEALSGVFETPTECVAYQENCTPAQ